jgi:hypothetical protein
MRRPSYREACEELVSLFDGIEPDCVRSIQRLFVEKPHEFMRVGFDPTSTTFRAGVCEYRPTLEASDLCLELLTAARAHDLDNIHVICHRVLSPIQPSPSKYLPPIDITKEMIRAGADILENFTATAGGLTNSATYVAKLVYEAMEKQKLGIRDDQKDCY